MIVNNNEKNLLLKNWGISVEKAIFDDNRENLEITNENGDVLNFFIGDFRKDEEDIITYIDKYNDHTNPEVKPLMIFNSWESEQNYYDKVIKGKAASDKRKIKNIFDQAKMAYLSNGKNIEFKLEQKGINFLEYIEGNIKGYIFNLSLFELSKLYNQTGKNLFKDNVRVGISNSKSNLLKAGFKEVFEIGLYHLFKNSNSKFLTQIELFLNEKFSQDYKVKEKILENFWFHHNGITIFSDENYILDDELISFASEKVSVINGAQTLTHCFSLMRDIHSEWENMFDEIIKKESLEKAKNDLTNLIDSLKKRVTLKVIFLSSNDIAIKRSITQGLNTQIPIIEEDILVNSEKVEKINKVIDNKGIRISKSGEYIDHKKSFSVLEFIKNYLTFIEKPGEARNLKKDDLKGLLDEIYKNLEQVNNLTNFYNALTIFSKIDEWWNKKQDPVFYENNISYDGLKRNGKYYFKSYCYRNINILDRDIDNEDELQEIYEEFIFDFIFIWNSEIPIHSNDFKKDILYNEFISYFERNCIISENYYNKINTNEMVEEISKNKFYTNSKSRYNLIIKKYLKSKGVNFKFRTVTMKNGLPKEDFPFSTNTFKSLFEVDNYPNIYNNNLVRNELRFENSHLKRAINEPFVLIVLTEETESISKIDIYEGFSFKTLENFAKNAYEKTIDAFIQGDTEIFPKISDDISFHIRPKAKDSKDTFEFTNGEQEIKRTFWANKEALKNLINASEKLNINSGQISTELEGQQTLSI